MNSLLNFLIFDDLMYYILIILVIMNSTLISIYHFHIDNYNKKRKNYNKKMSKLDYFKLITALFWMILLSLLFGIYGKNYFKIPIPTILLYIIIVCFGLKKKEKNFNNINYDNMLTYYSISSIYILCFSNSATQYLTELISNMLPYMKEYIIILFLIIKIVLYIFCLITNISLILVINKKLFKRQLNKIFMIIKKTKYIDYNFNLYKLPFSKNGENKKLLFFDIPFFILIFPFILFINLLYTMVFIFLKIIINIIIYLVESTEKYLNNSSEIISKSIRISIIIALLLIYLAILYSNYFSSETKDFYYLLTTVVLIPIIFDEIKNKYQKKQL